MGRDARLDLRFWSTTAVETWIIALLTGLFTVFTLLGSLLILVAVPRLATGSHPAWQIDIVMFVSGVIFPFAALLLSPVRMVEIRIERDRLALRGALEFGLGLLRNPVVSLELSRVRGWSMQERPAALALDLDLKGPWWEPLERDGSLWYFVPLRGLDDLGALHLRESLAQCCPEKKWPWPQVTRGS